MRLLSDKLKLYLVLETKYLLMPLNDFLDEVLKGGVSTVQLRNKSQNIDDKLQCAYITREITDKYGALFIINDNAKLAEKVSADGVHIGVTDEKPEIIRQKYSSMIIGYSCNNKDDVLTANQYADYAGIGPYTETNTKKDHRQILGRQGISNINSMLNIPAVAIGGINIDNAEDVFGSGVAGLAVSSFLCMSKKPYDEAKKLLEIINERV